MRPREGARVHGTSLQGARGRGDTGRAGSRQAPCSAAASAGSVGDLSVSTTKPSHSGFKNERNKLVTSPGLMELQGKVLG